jgi:hypothetical protein
MDKRYLTCRQAQPLPAYDVEQIAQGLGRQLESFLFPLFVIQLSILQKVYLHRLTALKKVTGIFHFTRIAEIGNKYDNNPICCHHLLRQ